MQSRIVEIASDNVHVSAERGFLKATVGGEIVGKVALDDIAGLVVRGYGASFSATVCDRLAERNAPIVICGQNQSPASVIWPVSGHHMQGFHMQAQAVVKKPLQKRLWAALVATKIRNQSFVLAHFGKEGSAALSSMATRVRSGDPDNMEARAARLYWQSLFGKGFRRDRNGDGTNAALNYGYTVLRAAAARSILAAGLHPSLAMQHASGGNSLRLADDLMEPFRPFVDLRVAELSMGNGTIEELTREMKASLVSVLSLDLKTSVGTSPLQIALDRLARSLAAVYCGNATKLDLPGFPVTRVEMA